MFLLRETDTQFQSQFSSENAEYASSFGKEKSQAREGSWSRERLPKQLCHRCATGKAAFSSFTSESFSAKHYTYAHTAFAHKNIK